MLLADGRGGRGVEVVFTLPKGVILVVEAASSDAFSERLLSEGLTGVAAPDA